MNYQNILITIIIVCIISGLLGLIIAAFSNFMKLPITEKNNKIEEVYKRLPGYNCGACGRAGCRNFAEAIVQEKEDYNKCRPMKKEQKEDLKKYLENN